MKVDPTGFEGYVKELLEFKRLDDSNDMVIGIAKLIATKGIEALTEPQLFAFTKHGILPHLYLGECGRCAHDIPWSEMLVAVEESGNCAYCQHLIDKDD
ncbi:hypothetical protein AK95_14430 [Paenibacillus sp. LC231]|nr:hypothetical protein AK95_14430 [Paenibacillus sp. LC231]